MRYQNIAVYAGGGLRVNDQKLTQQINNYAAQGWRLINVVPISGQVLMFFERPVQ